MNRTASIGSYVGPAVINSLRVASSAITNYLFSILNGLELGLEPNRRVIVAQMGMNLKNRTLIAYTNGCMPAIGVPIVSSRSGSLRYISKRIEHTYGKKSEKAWTNSGCSRGD